MTQCGILEFFRRILLRILIACFPFAPYVADATNLHFIGNNSHTYPDTMLSAALLSGKESAPRRAGAAVATPAARSNAAATHSPRLNSLGKFSNFRFTQEHQYGAAVELWEEEGIAFGQFSFSEGPIGDTPTGVLESLAFDRKTGAISFSAKLTMGQHICNVHSIQDNVPSRDLFAFKGVVSNMSISGELKRADGHHLDHAPKVEILVLKKNDEANSFRFESRKHWETVMKDVLKFRGPKW